MRTACTMPACPGLAVPGGRGYCQQHRRTTSQRGYDAAHTAARSRLALTLPAPCAFGCGRTLRLDEPWVAAHVLDGAPGAGWVAACPPCNERAKHGRLRPIADASVVHVRELRRTNESSETTEARAEVPFV